MCEFTKSKAGIDEPKPKRFLRPLEDEQLPCQDFTCRHNIFWEEIKFKFSKETEDSIRVHNCMCLLEDELTLEQIAQIYGITRERVRQIEEGAMRKFCAKVLESTKDDFSEDELKWIEEKRFHLEQRRRKKGEYAKKKQRVYAASLDEIRPIR